MKNLVKILSVSVVATMTGCVILPPDTQERLGQFTAVSSFNVRNLEYEKDNNTVYYTTGKSCYQVNIASLSYISGPKDDLLQRAMDDAIRAGQKSGIDGDLLVNARIERKTEYKEYRAGFFPVKRRYECVFVEGDLVKIKHKN